MLFHNMNFYTVQITAYKHDWKKSRIEISNEAFIYARLTVNDLMSILNIHSYVGII